MAKYSGPEAPFTRSKTPTGPIQTTDERTLTYNGDPAFVRDAKSELFVLAVNFMGETEATYYEAGSDRQIRFAGLIRQVTVEDPKWMQHFIPFLRNEAFMRTASVVAAVEYVRAGGPDGAWVIDSAIKRGDEPAELLGYYWSTNGGRKTIAEQIKAGLRLASTRLFNEFNALKYDGISRGIRYGDVIEMVHPKATSEEQHLLFEYLLDRRHHADDIRVNTDTLPMISMNRRLREWPQDQRREAIKQNPDLLRQAGMTWESLSEWLPGTMDAEAWELIIPSMGYMALLRNLRNFDEAGISDAVADQLIARLSDPEQVAKSMQFPYRFYSAFKNTHSNRWARALDQALDLSCANIPKLSGRSLVIVDGSGSMGNPVSGKSTLTCGEAAAIFGVAQFRAAGFQGDLVAFGDRSEKIDLNKGFSVLKGVESIMKIIQSGRIGYGTQMWPAVDRHFNGHDRIFLFTDMQANSFHGPKSYPVPVYFWNLGGYRASEAQAGQHEMAGLSDATFRQIALMEASKDATWPWGD